MTDKREMDKIKKFLSSIKNCTLVYHGDSDGVCSAALLSKFLKDKIKISSPNDSHGIYITEELIDEINNYDKNIFVDLAVNQWDFKKLNSEVLVIDHHSTKKDLNKEKNFIHINPRLKDPKCYIPASLLVYEILKKIDKKIEKYAWIAAVGTIGDKGDLSEIKFEEKYEDLKFLSDVIEANKGVKGKKGIEKAYEIFSKAETPEDVMDSNLINNYKKFEKALNDTLIDFRYHSQYFEKKDAYIYKIYNKYKITSTLATVLSEKKEDSAFFIYKRDKVLSMSARCQTSRINLAELMEKLSRGLGSGGGHPPAAAAVIPIENADKFMERLKNYLEGI